MVLVAIIAAAIMLMGCAIVALCLHDLKIGEVTTGSGEILDSDGNVVLEREMTEDVISLHGFINSPTYLAHQEWFEFYEEYSENHVITEEENFYVPPEEYEAYTAYNQELQDKIDEIAGKYDLKLLGVFAPFQRSERQVFYDAIGVDSLLVPGSTATIEQESGYFYEGGNFKVEFHMEMLDQENNWPYPMFNSIYYSRKDYFDDAYLNVGDIEFWDQWTYTTSSGMDVLIASYEYGAIVFCDKEDSIIYVRIENNYQTGYDQETDSYETHIIMTREQLEQVVDQIDFSIEVESVDMELAKAKLEKFSNVDNTGN